MKITFYKNIFLLAILSIAIFTASSCNNTKAADLGTNQNSESYNSAKNSKTKKALTISGSKFKEIYAKNKYTLVDVRTPTEFKQGTIKGAVNINVSSSSFATEIQKIDKSKPVMVFCRSGARSGRAMAKMSKLGFSHIYNLSGGYMGWKRAGL